MSRYLLLATLALLQAPAQALDGRSVSILDGDTLQVLSAGGETVRVRLEGIDAPEIRHGPNQPGQPFGEEAKNYLSQITAGKSLSLECGRQESYGRKVCRVWAGTLDINREMVSAGLAMIDPRYAKDRSLYPFEVLARIAKRGVWSAPSPIPPWDWRRTWK